MGEIIAAFKDTPIPNLLIIGGLILIGMALVGKVGVYVDLNQRRQILSALVGVFLLVAGIGISISGSKAVPETGQSTEPPGNASAVVIESTQPPASTITSTLPADPTGTEPSPTLPAATATPTNLPVLLSEKFDSPSPKWYVGDYSDEDVDATFEITDANKYRVSIKARPGADPNYPGVYFVLPDTHIKNFLLSFDVLLVELTGGAGLDHPIVAVGFRTTGFDQYRLRLFGDRYDFYVVDQQTAEWTAIKNSTASSAFDLVPNNPNRIQLRVANDEMTLSANGFEVASWFDSTVDRSGAIHIYLHLGDISQTVTADFDNIELVEIK